MNSKILELHKLGLSTRQIAKELKTHQTTVCRFLKKNGIVGPVLKTNKDLENRIINSYLCGESSTSIAEDVGVTPSTICRIIKRNGEKIRYNRSKYHFYNTAEIISWNGHKLKNKYIKTLSAKEKEELCDYLFKYFRTKGFPYPHFSDHELEEDFFKLEGAEGKIIGDEINSFGLAGNKISKHYCPHFFTVRNPSKPSLLECFYDDNLLKKTIKNRIDIGFNITGNMLRQGIRNSWNGAIVSVFRPELAKTIYKQFASPSDTVLDISAGFGQRMLGAYYINKYIGVDPWDKTIIALNQIKGRFKLSAELYQVGAENFICPEEVDFCFSSPPFFNKEIYSLDSSQACKDRTFRQFVKEWWRKVAENVHLKLKPNKYFVLNMDGELAPPMLKVIKDLFNVNRLLTIKYTRAHMGAEGMDLFYVLQRK